MAQSFSVIHNFSGGADGRHPQDLTINPTGSLYGTTTPGALNYDCSYDGSCGSVFELSKQGQQWTFTTLHQFAGGDDGDNPASGVTLGPDGSLYGTTAYGGGGCNWAPGCGTVFQLTQPAGQPGPLAGYWNKNILHRFSGGDNDGNYPESEVVLDADGNIFGTAAASGPYTVGVAFELTPSGDGWDEGILHNFRGALSGKALPIDGGSPQGAIILDASHNLYGTTLFGGLWRGGTVYRLSPSGSGWTETILHAFEEPVDGALPYAGLIADREGNLYGTACCGGPRGEGTVFKLSPSGGTWTFEVLYSFAGPDGGDGANPYGGLAIDAAGNLYGTTGLGSTYGPGSVFKLTHSNNGWVETVLHNFSGDDGALPLSRIVLDAVGHVYGTTSQGGGSGCGGSGCGVIFEITP
jgi:uncharacterized repeat protein (TIGR03803 family)